MSLDDGSKDQRRQPNQDAADYYNVGKIENRDTNGVSYQKDKEFLWNLWFINILNYENEIIVDNQIEMQQIIITLRHEYKEDDWKIYIEFMV